jgi:hypothetical protein
MNYGYIYIRNHKSYDEHNVYKLGKTDNIAERHRRYITNEFIAGYYIIVFEITHNQHHKIEFELKKKFNYLNKRINGGIEFFNRQIQYEIEPFLIENKFEYKILTKE